MDGTNPRLEIGGNNPPGTLELERAGTLIETATQWLASRPEIEDTAEADAAQGFVDRARALKKDLAAAQKVELVPHEAAIADVKAKYRGPLDKLEAALKSLLERAGAWIVKERQRIAAEKAAQEAEARRLREEAERAERERVEAERKAEEERRRVVEAEEASNADLARVEAERQEAIQAGERAAEAARTAKAAERAAEKKPEVASIKSEPAKRAMTMRAYWSAEVTDEGEALRSYASHPTVRAECLKVALRLANELARAEKREDAAPAGFRFIKEERAS